MPGQRLASPIHRPCWSRVRRMGAKTLRLDQPVRLSTGRACEVYVATLSGDLAMTAAPFSRESSVRDRSGICMVTSQRHRKMTAAWNGMKRTSLEIASLRRRLSRPHCRWSHPIRQWTPCSVSLRQANVQLGPKEPMAPTLGMTVDLHRALQRAERAVPPQQMQLQLSS